MTEERNILSSEIEKKGVKFECPKCGHEFFKIRGLFFDKEGAITSVPSSDTVTALTVVICGKCTAYNVNYKDYVDEMNNAEMMKIGKKKAEN